jgi:hypothetical protein
MKGRKRGKKYEKDPVYNTLHGDAFVMLLLPEKRADL